MSNKRITDLTELTTPTTDDVFPVVDIATNTTTKVQLGNLPTTTAVTTALATKQDTLVSGTNIKTVNSTSLLGSGNVAVQETLVSGTNIKTLNSTSLLGSGDIVLTANPSGVAGAIQFSNGSAFASDAANLFWDDTNNRLGVGTNVPSFPADVIGEIRSTTQVSAGTTGTNGAFLLRRTTDGNGIGSFSTSGNEVLITEFSGSGGRLVTGFGTTALKWLGSSSQPRIGIGFNGSILATAHIQGSGSTSATTSLLVQNSAGTTAFQIKDDMQVSLPSTASNNTLAIGGQVGIQKNGVGVGYTSGSSVIVRGGLFVNPNSDTVELYGGSNSIMSWINGEVLFKNANNGATISNPSAIVTIDSTTKGFLPPRMTTTQKNAIATPAAGLVVYDSTTNKLCCYNGSTWNDLF